MANYRPWAGRKAVVCGGTSGLGLHLLLELAQQGAHVAAIGRDRKRLAQAIELAQKSGASSSVGFSIDVQHTSVSMSDGDRDLSEWLVQNPVDLLINAVGSSDRGSLTHLTSEELADQFSVNVLSAWNMTRLSLASLQRASGVIVNIGSLAGLIATPNMGGYCVSKFGLTALSRQLRLELSGQGISVMIAMLGPIAREDAGQRYATLAQTRGLTEEKTQAPGGGAKLRLLDPQMVSQRILAAANARKREIVMPGKAKFLAALAPLWPSMADRILRSYLPNP
jgi:short-subunit dehydrogenase